MLVMLLMNDDVIVDDAVDHINLVATPFKLVGHAACKISTGGTLSCALHNSPRVSSAV